MILAPTRLLGGSICFADILSASPIGGFSRVCSLQWLRERDNDMNALTAKQTVSPPGSVRSVPNPILVEIEQIDDVCFLRFKGRFGSGGSSDYLNAKMDQIKALACTKFLADLEDVASVSSAGLSFIVNLYRASGGRMVLVRTQPGYIRHSISRA
jgi:anti-anti-sigma factor